MPRLWTYWFAMTKLKSYYSRGRSRRRARKNLLIAEDELGKEEEIAYEDHGEALVIPRSLSVANVDEDKESCL